MTKQTELPELRKLAIAASKMVMQRDGVPWPYVGTNWDEELWRKFQAAFHPDTCIALLDEITVLAAVKGEGEAVAYTTKCRLDLLKLKPEKAQTMWGEELLDDGDIPLYLNPRAEPSDGEMLAYAVEHGWPRCGRDEKLCQVYSYDGAAWFEDPLDAIRAAMKAAS